MKQLTEWEKQERKDAKELEHMLKKQHRADLTQTHKEMRAFRKLKF